MSETALNILKMGTNVLQCKVMLESFKTCLFYTQTQGLNLK